jgi:hypothetical protein
MATIPSPPHVLAADAEIDYPTGDSRPLGETPLHRDNLLTAVKTLERHFADEPLVYVSGNMFVYYEKGNRRKHVSPDVFVAVGVPKYLPNNKSLSENFRGSQCDDCELKMQEAEVVGDLFFPADE